MQLKPEEISKIIRAQIKHYENAIEQSETGTVIMVGDGIARASGLEKCMAGELLQFENGEYGMAQNLEEELVGAVILGSDQNIREGDTVKRTKRIVEVYGQREQSPEERLRDKDKRRAAYHRFYTNMKWGHAQNYHLTLDSGVIGIDKCVDIIAELY